MTSDPSAGLSAREREVMDIVHRLGEATAAAIERDMDNAPSNATVRSILRTLESKGHLTHGRDGATFVYRAVQPKDKLKRDALSHVLRTFFNGSMAEAVASLAGRDSGLSAGERKQLADLLRDLEDQDE